MWAEDVVTGDVALRRVNRTFIRYAEVLVEVSLLAVDGARELIRATSEHPFWTERGWVPASRLAAADRVRMSNGAWAAVADARVVHQSSTPVYNFEVDGLHTYFVGVAGYLVHNNSSIGRVTNVALTAGPRFKSHFIDKFDIITRALNIQLPRWRDGGGPQLLDALSAAINNGTLRFVGNATINKGSELMNIFRGAGITVVTKMNGEWVTVYEAGRGRDLGLMFPP